MQKAVRKPSSGENTGTIIKPCNNLLFSVVVLVLCTLEMNGDTVTAIFAGELHRNAPSLLVEYGLIVLRIRRLKE